MLGRYSLVEAHDLNMLGNITRAWRRDDLAPCDLPAGKREEGTLPSYFQDEEGQASLLPISLQVNGRAIQIYFSLMFHEVEHD